MHTVYADYSPELSIIPPISVDLPLSVSYWEHDLVWFCNIYSACPFGGLKYLLTPRLFTSEYQIEGNDYSFSRISCMSIIQLGAVVFPESILHPWLAIDWNIFVWNLCVHSKLLWVCDWNDCVFLSRGCHFEVLLFIFSPLTFFLLFLLQCYLSFREKWNKWLS